MSVKTICIYIAVIGLGASCAPRPKLVYVDLNEAQKAFSRETSAPRTVQPDARGAQGSSASLPGLSERIVTFPVTKDRLDQAKEMLQRSQDAAIREMTRRLRETYLAEVRKTEQERLAALEPSKQSHMRAVFIRIRELFDAYAKKRGPLQTRLALLAGFPDPDPTSSRVPDTDRKNLLRRFEEAKKIRAQIAQLAQDYDRAVAAELRSMPEAYDEALAQLRVDLEEMRTKAEQQAMDEARKQITSNREGVESLILGDPSVTLESIKEKRVAFAPTPNPQKVVADMTPSSEEMTDVKSDLDIWLAQQGYQLTSKGKGLNVTREFILWRKKKLNGH